MNEANFPAQPSSAKRWIFRLLLSGTLVAFVLLLYAVAVIVRSYDPYMRVKDTKPDQLSEYVGIYQNHPELGYTHIPSSRGEQILTHSQIRIPVFIDKRGFRAPLSGESALDKGGSRPLLMSLGCSFTFGDRVLGEQTYTHVAGVLAGRSSVNGGVSGYGLANMLISAKKSVPEVRPDYLVVQYSPWLADRAVSPFAMNDVGLVPAPYYSEDDGNIELIKPLFYPIHETLPLNAFRASEKSVVDFLSFVWGVGLPMFFHDDITRIHIYVGQKMGDVPSPAVDKDAVIKYAYEEFSRIAKENGAKLVVLVIGYGEDIYVPEHLFPDDAIVLNTQRELYGRLTERNIKSYRFAYWNIVYFSNGYELDFHPNPLAHAIIGEILAMRLIGDSMK